MRLQRIAYGSCRLVNVLTLAGEQRPRRVVKALWLHRVYGDTCKAVVQGRGRAGDEPTTTTVDQHLFRLDAKLGTLLGNFKPDSSLPRYDELMIVRRHNHGATLGCDLASDGFAVSRVAIIGDDLAAKFPGVVEF